MQELGQGSWKPLPPRGSSLRLLEDYCWTTLLPPPPPCPPRPQGLMFSLSSSLQPLSFSSFRDDTSTCWILFLSFQSRDSGPCGLLPEVVRAIGSGPRAPVTPQQEPWPSPLPSSSTSHPFSLLQSVHLKKIFPPHSCFLLLFVLGHTC